MNILHICIDKAFPLIYTGQYADKLNKIQINFNFTKIFKKKKTPTLGPYQAPKWTFWDTLSAAALDWFHKAKWNTHTLKYDWYRFMYRRKTPVRNFIEYTSSYISPKSCKIEIPTLSRRILPSGMNIFPYDTNRQLRVVKWSTLLGVCRVLPMFQRNNLQ